MTLPRCILQTLFSLLNENGQGGIGSVYKHSSSNDSNLHSNYQYLDFGAFLNSHMLQLKVYMVQHTQSIADHFSDDRQARRI